MRDKVEEVASTSTVGGIAKWLLIVFAAGVLAFLVWNADAPDVIYSGFVLLPWLVGPAALAALLAARARAVPDRVGSGHASSALF